MYPPHTQRRLTPLESRLLAALRVARAALGGQGDHSTALAEVVAAVAAAEGLLSRNDKDSG